MTKSINTTLSSINRSLTIASVGALIALAGLSGCSKSDDAKAAVHEASLSMSMMAAGDPNAADDYSLQTYRDADDLVSKHVSSETGYNEAAAVTSSLAKLGQASLAAKSASTLETQALHQARVIRGMINEYLTMSALANAASQFDPSVELSDIEKLITLRQADVQTYTAQRNETQARISKLDDQIADLHAKSNAQRNEAGALELEMPRVSATEAAQIAMRVREHTLRADEFELEAIRIEGVVGQLRPGAREITLNVEKASSQIELLKDARNEAHERDAASQADAKQANQAAQAAVDRIEHAISEYRQFRANDVLEANEKIASLIRGSTSALRDAKNALKQVASLTKSSAQQTLAESYVRQAGGYAEAAILYNALEEANVPGDWASLRQEALDLNAQATSEANEAFQGAATALRGARIRGDEGDKLEAAAVRLDQMGGLEPEPEYDDEDFEEENFDEDEG